MRVRPVGDTEVPCLSAQSISASLQLHDLVLACPLNFVGLAVCLPSCGLVFDAGEAALVVRVMMLVGGAQV